jgi:hypothetical protein
MSQFADPDCHFVDLFLLAGECHRTHKEATLPLQFRAFLLSCSRYQCHSDIFLICLIISTITLLM